MFTWDDTEREFSKVVPLQCDCHRNFAKKNVVECL